MNFMNFFNKLSNKKILSIVLLFSSIIISMVIAHQNLMNWRSYENNVLHTKVEGMTDCSGNNILVAVLNDEAIEPHKKLNIVREMVASFGTESKLNTAKINDILTSQTDSDVVKVDKLQQKLDELELCVNVADKKTD